MVSLDGDFEFHLALATETIHCKAVVVGHFGNENISTLEQNLRIYLFPPSTEVSRSLMKPQKTSRYEVSRNFGCFFLLRLAPLVYRISHLSMFEFLVKDSLRMNKIKQYGP